MFLQHSHSHNFLLVVVKVLKTPTRLAARNGGEEAFLPHLTRTPFLCLTGATRERCLDVVLFLVSFLLLLALGPGSLLSTRSGS